MNIQDDLARVFIGLRINIEEAQELEPDMNYAPEDVITFLAEDALNHKPDSEGQYLYVRDKLRHWGVGELMKKEYEAIVAYINLYKPALQLTI